LRSFLPQQVLRADGLGHRTRLAIVQRVVAAHDALQLRELAHHLGQQVGLGEMGGALGADFVGTCLAGDVPRYCPNALHAVELAAELAVIHHAGEPRDARGERRLAILVVEELGVGEPGAQHALVAADDAPGVARVQIGHEQEAVLQAGVVGGQREILLVALHGEDEAFLRNFQECFVEAARVDLRPFHERGHLIEEIVRFDDARSRRRGLQHGDDTLTAIVESEHDLAVRLEGIGVGVGGFDFDVLTRQEAVSGRHATRLEAEHRNGHDLAAVQDKKAVRRANELDVVVVAPRPGVTHHLGNRKLGERLPQGALQGGQERCAASHGAQPHVIGFPIGCDVEVVRAVARVGVA
jgi:hypothetical protein